MENEYFKGFCLFVCFIFVFKEGTLIDVSTKLLRIFGILVDEEVTDSGLQIKWELITLSLWIYARGNNILFILALEEKGNGKRMVFS